MIVHSLSSQSPAPNDRSNRGRLKNGNPSGDYMKAPRCGAKTRSGTCACRQPAMRNGRCRFHGGKSTGARTAEGRARCARARRTHGFYSAETVALRRDARMLLRRNRDLLAALRARPAGHGVLRSDSAVYGRSPVGKGNRRDAEAPRFRVSGQDPAFPLRERSSRYHSLADGIVRKTRSDSASLRLCVSAVDLPSARSSAGHGVLRSFLRFARTAARRLGL